MGFWVYSSRPKVPRWRGIRRNILRPQQIQTIGNMPNAYTMDHAFMLNISSTVIGLPTTGNTPNVYTMDHMEHLQAMSIEEWEIPNTIFCSSCSIEIVLATLVNDSNSDCKSGAELADLPKFEYSIFGSNVCYYKSELKNVLYWLNIIYPISV